MIFSAIIWLHIRAYFPGTVPHISDINLHSRYFLLDFSRRCGLSFLVKDLPSPVFKSSDRFLLNF